MFYTKQDELYKAVQASYTIEMLNFLDFINKVNLLSSNLIKTEFLNYQYAGITDIYMSEKEDIGNFLGRSSYFDFKTFNEAEKLILRKHEIMKIIKEHDVLDKFNIGLVYFNEDREGSEFNSTIIVNSQMNNIKNIDDLWLFATSTKFKQKILDFSVELLCLEDLKFVGISDFYKIKGKGLFAISGNFKNFKSITSELIKTSELEQKFDDVMEDYSYVS